jgi:hypothetical protein
LRAEGAGPRCGPCGEREKKGLGCQGEKGPAPREKEKRAGRAAGLGRCSLVFPFLLFFFFSTLKPFKLFKPYKLNTRKIMLQHECTNKLIL